MKKNMLERRKPPETFWPTHIFQEALVMLLVFVALVLMVVLFPPEHESVARPMDTGYIPRPEWFFLFLFETLQFFPGKLEFVGANIVPALGILALLLLPFIDRNPATRVAKRPIASGIGLLAVLALLFLTAKGMEGAPPSIKSSSAFVELGEGLYQKQSCASCHTINGLGKAIGPDLAGINERRTLSWVHRYLEDPLAINPKSAMPGYQGSLTHEEIEGISMYIMGLEKGPAPTGEIPREASPAPQVSAVPAQVPHGLEGRSNCLACHQTGIGEAPQIPADHSGRSNNLCLSCHQSKQ